MTLAMPARLMEVTAAGGGSAATSLLIFALPVLLILFMVFSQRRRQREVQSLQSTLAVGDAVTTTSGLYGTIKTLDESTATLEIAPGVTVRFDRRAIGTKTVSAGPAAPSTTD